MNILLAQIKYLEASHYLKKLMCFTKYQHKKVFRQLMDCMYHSLQLFCMSFLEHLDIYPQVILNEILPTYNNKKIKIFTPVLIKVTFIRHIRYCLSNGN